jgi:hypothetical protein
MHYKFAEIRKAVAAFLVGLAGFLTVSLPLLTDGQVTNTDIVATVAALAAWLGSTAAVYQTPNATKGELK